MESKKSVGPVHPGVVLYEKFMKPLGLTQHRLAHDLSVPPQLICQMVDGQQPMTADMALRLAQYFGTSANVWMGLQTHYDLASAQAKLADQIKREVKVLPRTVKAVLA